ncbi:hypothetical protein Tco_0450508 [Tanacetum coccineum]
MPGRPRKKRVKIAGENPSVPKPITIVKKVPAYEYLVARNPNSWCRAFFNLNVKSSGSGQIGAKSDGKGGMGSSIGAMGTDSGGRGGRGGGRASMGGVRGRRGGARGRRGGGRGGRRGGGRGSTSGLKLMDEDDIRQNPLNDYRFPDQEESMDVEMYNRTKASINFMVNTHESITHGKPSSVEAANVQPAESEPANVPPV